VDLLRPVIGYTQAWYSIGNFLLAF
jgi:hypothetical protein